MADSLSYQTVTAFPGVDGATADHLIQPGRMGASVMRRMLNVDTFDVRGAAEPARGYAHYAASETTILGMHAHITSGSVALFVVDADGSLWRRSGSTWTRIWQSLFAGATRVRFATGFNALFMFDGVHAPAVWGWNYDPADTTITWVDAVYHTVGRLKNTYGAPDEDFLAEGGCFHADRLVLHKGNEVRISAPAAPTKFYDAGNDLVQQSWFLVEEGDSTDVNRSVSYENQVLIAGKPYSLHGYLGSDPATSYSRIILDASRGFYAPDSVALGLGDVWFCSYEGACKLSVKNGVDFIGEPVKELWGTLTNSQRQQVVGWFEDGIYYIVLPVTPEGYSTLGQPSLAKLMLAYDPVTKRWNERSAPFGHSTLVLPEEDEMHVLTHDGAGHIWRQNSGTAFNHYVNSVLTPVNPTQELVTPWWTMGEPWRSKWLRMFHVELREGAPTIEFSWALDFQDTWKTLTLTAKGSQVTWGQAGALWLPPTDPAHVLWEAPGKYTIELPESIHCRSVRFRLRGTGLRLQALGVGFMYEGT